MPHTEPIPRPGPDPGELGPGARVTVRSSRGAVSILVSPEDLEAVSASRLRRHADGRILRGYTKAGRRREHALARFIAARAGIAAGRARSLVRHRNGDPLDFRRGNLAAIVARVELSTDPKCRRRPYRVRVSVDLRDYRCGSWPAQWQAEEALRRALEAAAELEGRGLPAHHIRRELRAAAGVVVRRADWKLSNLKGDPDVN